MPEIENCIFCKIVKGSIPAEKVLETEKILVFKDISSKAPVHLLAIPKEHVADLKGISILGKDLFETIAKVSEVAGINSTGFRVVMNQGQDAGQEIEHIHFHILGGRKLLWPPG